RSTVELEGFRNVRDVGDVLVIAPLLNSLAAQEFGADDGDYYLADGGRVTWRHGLGTRGEWSVAAGREWISALPVRAAPASGRFRPNVPLGDGGVDLVTLGVRRRSEGFAVRRDVHVELALELGRRDGGMAYARIAGAGHLLVPLGGTRLLLRTQGGAATRDVPPHRAFAFDGTRDFWGLLGSASDWTGPGVRLGFGEPPMAEATFPDEWLVQSLEGLVDAERLAELRGKADPAKTLWETLVAAKICTDEQILAKLSTRFRMKVADPGQIDPKVREAVPESLARRYRILPLRITDSFLEVATANPFDMHAEKDLAFATAREVRLLLLAPSQINARLDELYRPDKAINKLLSGMEASADIVQLADQLPAEELKITEEEASQRPVVRLVDMIISEGILQRSSDIHIEPEEGGVAVRYRIDGA